MTNTIIHVNTARDVFGPEKTTINECLDLMDNGFDCHVVNLDGDPHIPFNDKISKTNIKYTQLACRSGLDIRAILSLSKIIKQYDNVLIHSHGYKADLHALIAGKLSHVPLVTTIHGWTTESLKVKVYEFIQQTCWRFYERVFCVSNNYLEVALKLGINSNKLYLIYNGIKIEDKIVKKSTEFRDELGVSSKTLLVGIIGRLSEEKGHFLFIDIAEKIKEKCNDVKFVIIGDGPDRNILEKYANDKNLTDYVIFAGHQDNMKNVYDVLDLVIMCSFREGLPNVLLESMFQSIPVVTVPVGGIPEVLADNQGGIMVDNRDVEMFSSEVEKLLINGALRKSLGEIGHERVCNFFSFEKRMKKMYEHYSEMLTIGKM